MIRKLFIIASLGFISLNISAEVYQYTDANGVLTFTDQPTTQSKKVNLPSINITSQPIKPNISSTNASTNAAAHVDYEAIAITSPKDQETIQNAANIAVQVETTPALQTGDKIQCYLDDKLIADSDSASCSIPKTQGDQEILSRGTHSISAAVTNANGDILKKSSAITVFIHYVNLNSPNKAR